MMGATRLCLALLFTVALSLACTACGPGGVPSYDTGAQVVEVRNSTGGVLSVALVGELFAVHDEYREYREYRGDTADGIGPDRSKRIDLAPGQVVYLRGLLSDTYRKSADTEVVFEGGAAKTSVALRAGEWAVDVRRGVDGDISCVVTELEVPEG